MAGEGASASSSVLPGAHAYPTLPMQFCQPRVGAGVPISGPCVLSPSKAGPLGLGCNYGATPSSGVVSGPLPASNGAPCLGPPPGSYGTASVVGPRIDAPASALPLRSTLSAWQHAQRRVYPDALAQHLIQHQADAINIMEETPVGDIKASGERGYLMSGHPATESCSVSDSAMLDIAQHFSKGLAERSGAPIEQQTLKRGNEEVMDRQFDLEERIAASECVSSGYGVRDADGENCRDLTGLLEALSEEPGSPVCFNAHDVDMCDQPLEPSMEQPLEQLCEQPFEQPSEAGDLNTKLIKCEADTQVPDLTCRASKEASTQNVGDLSSLVILLDSDSEDDESMKVSEKKASPGSHNSIHKGLLGLEWIKVEPSMSKVEVDAKVKKEEGGRGDRCEEGKSVLSSITASGLFLHPDPMPLAQIPQNFLEAGLSWRPPQAMRSDSKPTVGVNKGDHHGKFRSHLAVLRKQLRESFQGFRTSAGSLKTMGISGVTSAQESCSLQVVQQPVTGELPVASSVKWTKGPTDGGLPTVRNPSVNGIEIPTYMENCLQVAPIKKEYNDSILTTDRDTVLSTLRLYKQHHRQCKLDEFHFQMASTTQNLAENPLPSLKIAGRTRADIEAYNRVKDGLKLPKLILGEVPGIEIGDVYTFRHEMAVVGLHHLPNVGIAYGPHPVDGIPTATAVVICPKGFYSDNIDEGYRVLYCGQGGRPDRSRSSQVTLDQKYEKGNRALCMNYERKLPVRLIRAHSYGGGSSAKAKIIGYTYDGVYRIVHREYSPGSSGTLVYKFGLERIENQPPIPPCLSGCKEHAWNFREIDLPPIPLQVSSPVEKINVWQIEV